MNTSNIRNKLIFNLQKIGGSTHVSFYTYWPDRLLGSFLPYDLYCVVEASLKYFQTKLFFAYIKIFFMPLVLTEDERYRSEQGPGETGLLHWVTSSELLHTLISSSSELMETINQVKGRDKGISCWHLYQNETYTSNIKTGLLSILVVIW